MMQPASYVGKTNYELLGNNRVGETHASRMARVNAATMSGPTLVGELAQQPVINGSNMGLSTNKMGGLDVVAYGLVGGVLGGLFQRTWSKDSKGTRGAGAMVGAGLGAAFAYYGHRGTPIGTQSISDLNTGTTFVGALVAGSLATLALSWHRTNYKGKRGGKKGTIKGQLGDPMNYLPLAGAAVVGASLGGVGANKLYAALVGGAMGLLGVAMVNNMGQKVYD
tara:strand:+ start:20 stop:688 length:669 start_codon:yes stop_codon:yes gene_type:complete